MEAWVEMRMKPFIITPNNSFEQFGFLSQLLGLTDLLSLLPFGEA
jgi:hypothetical protein